MSTTLVGDNVTSAAETERRMGKPVMSFAMSKRYLYNMLQTTVANILYHRLDLNEKDFITKKMLKTVIYKSFKPGSRNPFIRSVRRYITACKDTLDNNYLRDLHLFFIDVVTGDVVETYTFTFRYADSTPLREQKLESVLASMCQLLRTLEDLGKHKKCDREVQLRIELTCLDDTPVWYEPPAFHCVRAAECLAPNLDENRNSVFIATLFTGYHRFTCRGEGEIFNFRESLAEEA